MADPTLRTINDTIHIYNGNVGIGSSSPQNLLHIEGGIYTYQLGNMNSNIDMQQTVLANASSLYASTIVTTPRIASLTSNIDLTYSTLTNINTIAVDNLTAVTNGNIYFSGKSLSNIANMYVSKDVFISGNLRASNLEIFGETTLLQTTTCNTDQFTITNYNTGPALVVTQQGTSSPVATFRSASGTDPALFINNNGWVGLGTETVNSQLHVWDTASATVDTIEIIEATNAARQAQLKLQNVQTNATLTALTSGTVTLVNNGAFPLTLGTNGTDKIRIDSAGNVGVGTNSASYGIHLYNASAPVAEQIQTGGAFTASLNMKNTASQFSIDTTTTSTSLSNVNAFPLTFGTSATERVRIDAAGNVGIGTNAPAYDLHLYETSRQVTEHIQTAGAFNVNLNMVNNASQFSINATTTSTSLSNVNAFPLTFGTSATERMRIDATGNVGIGTTNPAYVVDIYGPAGATQFSASNTYTTVRNIFSIRTSGINKFSFNINRVLGSIVASNGGSGTAHTFVYLISWTNAQTVASLPIRIESSFNVAENSTPSSYFRSDINVINPNTRLVLGTGVNQAIASGTVLVAGTTPIAFANSTTTATQVTHGFFAKSATTALVNGRIYVNIDVFAPQELGDVSITYVNYT